MDYLTAPAVMKNQATIVIFSSFPVNGCLLWVVVVLTSLTSTPHPVIVHKDYIRVLLHSHYTTVTKWGVLLKHPSCHQMLIGDACLVLSENKGTLI